MAGLRNAPFPLPALAVPVLLVGLSILPISVLVLEVMEFGRGKEWHGAEGMGHKAWRIAERAEVEKVRR